MKIHCAGGIMTSDIQKIIYAILKGCTTDEEISEETKIDIQEIKKIKADLIQKGAIEESIAIDPNHEEINRNIVVYHQYKCRGGPEEINDAALKMSKLPYIEEIHSVIGKFDLLVKFRVSSLREYHKMLNEDIWGYMELAGIVDSMGMVSLHTYLDRAGYEIKEFREE